MSGDNPQQDNDVDSISSSSSNANYHTGGTFSVTNAATFEPSKKPIGGQVDNGMRSMPWKSDFEEKDYNPLETGTYVLTEGSTYQKSPAILASEKFCRTPITVHKENYGNFYNNTIEIKHATYVLTYWLRESFNINSINLSQLTNKGMDKHLFNLILKFVQTIGWHKQCHGKNVRICNYNGCNAVAINYNGNTDNDNDNEANKATYQIDVAVIDRLLNWNVEYFRNKHRFWSWKIKIENVNFDMLNGLGIGFIACNHLNNLNDDGDSSDGKKFNVKNNSKNTNDKNQATEKEKDKDKEKDSRKDEEKDDKKEDKTDGKEKKRVYTPYIQDFHAFMDTPSINIGFGIFFAKNRSYINKNTNEAIRNLFNVSAFCEPRFYQTYFISKYFNNDGGLMQLDIGDEIGLLMDHETEMSHLFINDTHLGKVFFGAPPYFVPCIHCWLDKPVPYPTRDDSDNKGKNKDKDKDNRDKDAAESDSQQEEQDEQDEDDPIGGILLSCDVAKYELPQETPEASDSDNSDQGEGEDEDGQGG